MKAISAVSPVAGNHTVVAAIQHVRSMHGGAQAQLMRCSDGKLYVVKFRNNPQDVRILANEFIVSKLARLVGLTVPAPAIVEVEEWLVENSPGLTIKLVGREIPCASGLQFGSQYAIDPIMGRIVDFIPATFLGRVRNIEEFAGILAVDKWTNNSDGRQAVYFRRSRERKYTATFIDYGYCFNGGEWTFPDYPLRGAFPRNDVYRDITGWESFEPWLSRMENLDKDLIWGVAGSVPPVWYNSQWDELRQLAETLIKRQAIIRDLIRGFQASPRRPFPKWGWAKKYWLPESHAVDSAPHNLPMTEAVG